MLLACLSGGWFASTVVAGPGQDEPQGPPEATLDPQTEAPNIEITDELDREYGYYLRRIRETTDAALAELDLSEEQKARLNATAAEASEKVRAIIRKDQAFRTANMDRIKEIQAQIQEAKEGRGEAGIGELSIRLARFFPGPDRVRKAMISFDKQMASTLEESKSRAYYEIARRVRLAYGPHHTPVGPTALLMALNRLELTPEQQSKIQDERKRMSEEMHEATKLSSREAIDAVTDRFRERVLDVLTAEQRPKLLEFEKEIQNRPL